MLDPPVIMEELYKRDDKYSLLEDNIPEVAQTVMITNQSVEGDKSYGKKLFKHKEDQHKDRQPFHGQS